jgi:DNA-directed RNA polymerase I subunit RPA34.5
MARKKDSGKSTALSQEYIIDSDSDGITEAGSSAQKGSSDRNGDNSLKKKQKRVRSASSESASQSDSSATNGSTNGENDIRKATSSSSEISSNEQGSETEIHPKAMETRLEKKIAPLYGLLVRKWADSWPQHRLNPIPVAIPARPFRLPNGFQAVRPDVSDFTSEAAEALSGDHAGKQVWHITAPASVPLASIEKFDLEAVRSGNPVLKYREKEYGFSAEPNALKHLLLPEGTNSTYKRLKTSISKSYHLREVPDHFQTTKSGDGQLTEVVDFFAKETPQSKAAPKQPEMLRMRYKPFGINESLSASTIINRSAAQEETNGQAVRHRLSPAPEQTPKKKKKTKKKKHERLGSNEDGLMDNPMQIDAAPSQVTRMQESDLEEAALKSRIPKKTNGIDEDFTMPGKKRSKRKKIREELPW